jgi:hypothetical protein
MNVTTFIRFTLGFQLPLLLKVWRRNQIAVKNNWISLHLKRHLRHVATPRTNTLIARYGRTDGRTDSGTGWSLNKACQLLISVSLHRSLQNRRDFQRVIFKTPLGMFILQQGKYSYHSQPFYLLLYQVI